MSYFRQSDMCVWGEKDNGGRGGYKHVTSEGKSRFSKPQLGWHGQPFLCGLIAWRPVLLQYCFLYETEITPEKGTDMGPAEMRLVAEHLHGPSPLQPTAYALSWPRETCSPPAVPLNLYWLPTACKLVNKCVQELYSTPSWSAPTASSSPQLWQSCRRALTLSICAFLPEFPAAEMQRLKSNFICLPRLEGTGFNISCLLPSLWFLSSHTSGECWREEGPVIGSKFQLLCSYNSISISIILLTPPAVCFPGDLPESRCSWTSLMKIWLWVAGDRKLEEKGEGERPLGYLAVTRYCWIGSSTFYHVMFGCWEGS